MTGIFSSNAERYWAAGLPVIPLREKEKAPIPYGWSDYSDHIPSEEVQHRWLRDHPNSNLGLVLGKQADVCMLDVDTDDVKVHRLVETVLPRSPWRRFGRKGFALAFRFNGLPTFRVKSQEGGSIVESLSSKTQLVLPPSIHPDTQKPYTANCDLIEVYDSLPKMPKDAETLIRRGLSELGYTLNVTGFTKLTEWVAPGARDNKMISMAGFYAHAILKGEITFLEGINHLQSWYEGHTQKVAGDDIDINKGVRRMAEFLINDVTGEKHRPLPPKWDLGLSDEDKVKMGLEVLTDSFKRVPLDVLKQELHMAFVATEDEGQRFQLMEDTLDRVARYTPNALAEELFLKSVSSQSALGISPSALKKRLRELRQGETEGLDHAEIAGCVIKHMAQFGELRFCHGGFWQWTGSHWGSVDDTVIMKVIAEEFGSLPAARKANDHMGILKVMSRLVNVSLTDSSVQGVNFANGYLNSDLKLVEHNSQHGSTYTLPYRYLPELANSCPKWLSFLNSRWEGDVDKDDKIAALQEAMGAALMGISYKFQRAILLKGVAFCGKSRVLVIMRGLLPDNAICTIPPTDWGDKFIPAEFTGKAMNSAGELSESRPVPGDLFKKIIEGEPITAQYKNKDPFTLKVTCSHWFGSNHLPKTRDTSDGFNRRWLIITFNKQVPASQRKIDFAEDLLAEEREAIAAWAISSVPRLLHMQEYTLPKSHKEAVEEMAETNDSVRFFLRHSTNIRTGVECNTSSVAISSNQLFAEYSRFCMMAGDVRPVGLRSFLQRMKNLEDTFRFKIVSVKTPTGQDEVSFENIMYVH